MIQCVGGQSEWARCVEQLFLVCTFVAGILNFLGKWVEVDSLCGWFSQQGDVADLTV